MAYDDELADRLRAALGGSGNVTEKRMFGGLAFLVDGRIAVAANSHGALMARVDPAEAAKLCRADHVRPVVVRGREMAGWLQVDTAALASDEALRSWVERGLAVVAGLGR